MATVNEKLVGMLREVMPQLEASLESGDLATQMAVAALRPSLERKISEQLERPADELDAALAGVIDTLARLRSDDAAAIVTDPRGARFALFDSELDAYLPGDPVRGPDPAGGPDGMRQVDGGA